ncbi:adenosylcobinamide-GDP ribazoletransferase [uncultured Paraglaciecola sp.]|jgi:adenosylcobinamide-GDP ribazoletransferase|uniref:adenosylcobinamide-GDP ribazoletransferase n=1 Tax=uncultured Paraglaciecola sp. TaxID=1765024 RepID=UPI0025FB679A|nr:adenosylcobinamide-GDP ribazoletransferase [uncultured Paraglaciecola sp.]
MHTWLKYHLNLFCLALGFFSRLPMAKNIQYSPSKMRRATRYFPLVGWLLASLLSAVYWMIAPLVGISPAICLLIVLSLLMTGALHEDGLADTFDGFFGGFTQERKLAIMKDSRNGTYGTCALVMALLSKFVLLNALAEQDLLVVSLLLAYPLSRAMAISLVQDMPHLSNQVPGRGSKSEPAAKPFSPKVMCLVLITGALACVLLPFWTVVYVLIGCSILRYWLRFWMTKHINGYTGDCLGTAQQLQELLIYMIILSNSQITL